MDIGIGIPNTIPDTSGAQLLDWARRAEAAGFSSLATIGAVSYPGYEELTVFAAAGAVTERIRFLSNVLIAPARSTAELAKAGRHRRPAHRWAAHPRTGHRLAHDGLPAHRRDFDGRGRRFDEQLRDLQTAWSGEPLSTAPGRSGPLRCSSPACPCSSGGRPTPASGGRRSSVSAGPPAACRRTRSRRWSRRSGRPGPRPVGEDRARIVALAYFSLGDTADTSHDNLFDYYRPMGDAVAEMIAGSALRSEDAIKGALEAYAQAGVDELILDPTVPSPEQVDLLAGVVL